MKPGQHLDRARIKVRSRRMVSIFSDPAGVVVPRPYKFPSRAMYPSKAYKLRMRPDLASFLFPGFPWVESDRYRKLRDERPEDTRGPTF